MGDTVLPNGRVYKIMLSNMPGEPDTQLVRVDSGSANVYQYVTAPSPGELLMDSLRATLGSVFIRGGWEWGPTRCIAVDTSTLFGTPTVVKRFLLPIVPHADYSLAYGFGRTQFTMRAEDPCFPLLINYVRTLTYTKIAGTEYGTFVGVDQKEETTPTTVLLMQNFPNPFNNETNITYSLPTGGPVLINVSDILGRAVAIIVNEYRSAGDHSVRWSAKELPSGVYFCSLHASGLRLSRKLILLR